MKLFGKRIPIAVSHLVLLLLLGSTSAAADNLALVVGVSSYGDDRSAREAAGFEVPTKLPNAVNDARLVKAALEAAGFSASLVEDPSKRQLVAAINGFAEKLREAGPDALGFFYFAGHGAQGVPPFERDVDNFLIPVDADLKTETDLDGEAVGLSRISAALSGTGANAVILVLDACRNFALPSATRSGLVTRGLAEARAYPGTMIAYSTAPGELASDGPRGGNGPFAKALAAQLRGARGTRVEDIFIEVRRQVLGATSNGQTPWENASLQAKVTIGEAETSVPQDPTSTRPTEITDDVEHYLILGRTLYDQGKMSAARRVFLVAAAADEGVAEVVQGLLATIDRQCSLRCMGDDCPDCDGVPSPRPAKTEEYSPIYKAAPTFPHAAVTIGLEGYCVVEYTVTKLGWTRDARVVEGLCTSDLFRDVSIEAALQFKYSPRVVDGETVDVPGVRNKFKFELE